MSILEEKIKKNKEYFDSYEPSEKHFSEFKDKLTQGHSEKSKKVSLLSVAWKVAASVVIIAVVALLLKDFNSSRQVLADDVMIKKEQIPQELREVKTYYQSINEEKLNQINNMSCTEEDCAELKAVAREEINELNRDNEELEKDLVESNNDHRVMNAIVNNYQLMSKLLDKVIVNLNKVN